MERTKGEATLLRLLGPHRPQFFDTILFERANLELSSEEAVSRAAIFLERPLCGELQLPLVLTTLTLRLFRFSFGYLWVLPARTEKV